MRCRLSQPSGLGKFPVLVKLSSLLPLGIELSSLTSLYDYDKTEAMYIQAIYLVVRTER